MNNAQAEQVGRLRACPRGHETNRTNWLNTSHGGRWYASCTSCEWQGPWSETEQGAIDVWNERTEAAAEIERMAGEMAELRAAVKVLRDGYADAVGGYRYIIQRYGRMDGVGWDRVIDHYDQWVMIPEREGLLAGSHKLAALGGGE